MQNVRLHDIEKGHGGTSGLGLMVAYLGKVGHQS
jgi:hypothetical protein